MIRLLLLPALAASPLRAEFRPFGQKGAEPPAINFCASGKLIVYLGSCSPGGKKKDVISAKSCDDAEALFSEGLPLLYPNAMVEGYTGLTAGEVMDSLMRPGVLGFFFVGDGDTRGAFITGQDRERVYPDSSACMSDYDLFAGFTSHSKYSPSAPAPKSDRALVISRTQTYFGGQGAPAGSWAKLCKPKISLVYPTRTFAGRIKDDIKKFFALLQEQKNKQVMKTLAIICDNCEGHVAEDDELAQFCPPNSNVCRARKTTPATEKFVFENYCLALAPPPAR
ncbi:MAG: hypothetical protein COX65_05865 [Elusimicrobia bacterium CG_4_10_14_0_2_um_filter_56_8]|nr:MAG: hypothetical protein AUJ51_10805 [Elusimicrobia bacterium CG1_02_56_21]PJA14287.1 MAG: hypothetical protein COX65_05865 [Elusimicrobia bacterium CG_4_10_14_0_2_um_filter_56_8]